MKNNTDTKDLENDVVQEVEELEAREVPGLNFNHNETLVRDGKDLENDVLQEVEELEAREVPGIYLHNHNETLVRDE